MNEFIGQGEEHPEITPEEQTAAVNLLKALQGLNVVAEALKLDAKQIIPLIGVIVGPSAEELGN